MKKTYIAPRAEVNVINAVQMICESLPSQGKYTGTQTLLGKDRGDYEPAEDGNFGDLW